MPSEVAPRLSSAFRGFRGLSRASKCFQGLPRVPPRTSKVLQDLSSVSNVFRAHSRPPEGSECLPEPKASNGPSKNAHDHPMPSKPLQVLPRPSRKRGPSKLFLGSRGCAKGEAWKDLPSPWRGVHTHSKVLGVPSQYPERGRPGPWRSHSLDETGLVDRGHTAIVLRSAEHAPNEQRTSNSVIKGIRLVVDAIAIVGGSACF